jgi:hypothetical protein
MNISRMSRADRELLYLLAALVIELASDRGWSVRATELQKRLLEHKGPEDWTAP